MIPIVTYHAIGEGPRPLWISVNDFEAHLDAYRKAGYRTMSLAGLLSSMREGILPEDALVLTFDDGYESVYSLAWPRMRAAGFSGTVFLITDYCGKTNQWPGQGADVPPSPLMRWEQVLEMTAEGCEFGAHTRTHPNLAVCTSQEATEQLTSARDRIQAITGAAAEVFAYPYGETDARTKGLVSQFYRGAVGTRLGIVQQDSNQYLLPRIDAYYLTPALIQRMKSPGFRMYLEARQGLRYVRRLLH